MSEAAIAPAPAPPIATDELVKLCAVDNALFEKTFFPKSVRQPSAPFHADMSAQLEDPRNRFLNMVAFRDSAKTTKLRMFAAKRVAFNISKTILYVGSSEAHAVRSVQWLRGRIEERLVAPNVYRKDLFAQVFGLKPGKKWTDDELEIFHGVDEQPIWIKGVGITGNIRGINFEDYRPDLIILDDVLTDENAATKEQRDKISDLVTGALKNSLAPATEAPNAKLAMLNTPQDGDDVVARAERDPDWTTIKYSCWTKETEGLAIDQQVSSWEARYPTPERRQQKRNAITAHRLSSFVKEQEVRVITKENAIFLPQWLKFYSEAPTHGQTILFIDPTPPPSEKAISKKKIGVLDYEVVGAMRRCGGDFYLLDYEAIQGTNPDWTIAKFFEFLRYHPYKAVVEGVAYQRTLKWILENEMKRRQRWITVETFDDIRSKPIRIQSTLHGLASAGRLHVKAEHVGFIEQFEKYPNVEHDDILDGASMGVAGLTSAYVDLGEEDYQEIDNRSIPKMAVRRYCP